MSGFTPSLSHGAATAHLDKLIATRIDPDPCRLAIQRLRSRFAVFVASCPPPWPAPGLIISPEIRYQSERYLPLAEITAAFYRLYRLALNYPPIHSSTPFHNALSWADVFGVLPQRFQVSASPAQLLDALLADREQLVEFLFYSFLPRRFYGGSNRYPGQRLFIRDWLKIRKAPTLSCLDAACGTGEQSYDLADLLIGQGYAAGDVRIEGWTIEPLEIWAATHARFSGDLCRKTELRRDLADIFRQGYHNRMCFHCADLLDSPLVERFDLILCNGLLGGPIINTSHELERVAGNLAGLLAPAGMLLVADSFHGGWKQKYPQQRLRVLFEALGLNTMEAGEGLAGLKPDQ